MNKPVCLELSILQLSTQPARNFPGIFIDCSRSLGMFSESREHLGNILKKKKLKKFIDEKFVFALKVYDLTIKTVDLLRNSSYHKAMFPEYSKNIPEISVSKIFQGYPWNIVMLWKLFYEVKKLKKIVLWIILWKF